MAQHGYLPQYDEAPNRDEDRDRRRDEDRNRSFMFGDRDRGSEGSADERRARDFRSSMDDHYLSWRDKQMRALDRDYDEYRREREQQFHREFDEWRRRKHGNPQPLRTGMTQTGLSSDPSAELQLTSDEAVRPAKGPDPIATATLGTQGGEGR